MKKINYSKLFNLVALVVAILGMFLVWFGIVSDPYWRGIFAGLAIVTFTSTTLRIFEDPRVRKELFEDE